MPSKLQAYSQMADHAAVQITGSHQSWMAFLQTVARLYKYPYNEQVMIHAQRPNATACAEYDFWNEKWGRYVRRGSKGIALIDASEDRPKLKYVFDVADTGTRENSRTVRLWELRPEHLGSVAAMLEHNYEVSGEDGLHAQLEHVAAQLADEYWNEHQQDMLDIVADSFLEEYDDFNIGVQFRNAATVSITYALMSRCGLEPDEYFEHEDFLSVFDFNTPETVAALGTAVSEINQQVLRQIEITIRNYEREHSAERTNEYGRTDLQPERGLPDSQPDAERAAVGSAGQVWQDAEDVSEGAPSGAVEPPDSLGEALPPSEGDRRDGEPEAGADDARDGESGRRDGEPESLRPDEVDGPYEQSESAGGGNHPDRTGFQLSFFPSEAEQIQKIDEAESVSQTPFAFSIAQQDIDEPLHPVKAEPESEAIPPQPITQEDIDDALRAWNGNAASKRAVERYMAGHARDKGTAAWLAGEYGSPDTKALLITKTGSKETVELSWAKVQRRVAQLIQADNFFTEQDRDDFADIDPAVIRENLESPAAQERVDAMLEAAEKIAAESAVEPYERFSVVETASGYAIWDDLHDGYYLDDEGVSEDFTSEWQANAYLEEIRKATVDKEVAEWQYVERAKVEPAVKPFPYAVGDTVYLEDGKPFLVENVTDMHIELRDPTLLYPIWRSESVESFARLMARYPQSEKPTPEVKDNTKPEMTSETVAVYPAEENNLPYDVVIERLHIDEPKHDTPDKAPAEITPEPENFRITDDNLGAGGPKAKYRANLDAINTLLQIEREGRSATLDEQEVLSKYVGWGGLADAFDDTKPAWSEEYQELAATLTPEEYAAARASTLNAHYTSPKDSGETELPEENPLVALIFPNEVKRVIRYRVCEPLLDKMEDACEFRVDDERFNLAFEREGLVTIDGETYLIAPAFAFFRDEDGVPMSINAEALDALEDYLEENGTEISFGKEKYPAVRLEGEICEGV